MLDLKKIQQLVHKQEFVQAYGEVETISEQLIVSKGPVCKIGDLCFIGEQKTPCEVISLRGEKVFLMPLEQADRLAIKDKVYSHQTSVKIPPINTLLGRTIDGLGRFIDGMDPLLHRVRLPIELNRKPPNSLQRERIRTVMPTGVKAIDAMLTIGEGQKIGIFAGTGVGKSTLLGMIARTAKADINVIALIGERGREVKEFIENDLGAEGMERSILVVSTSDEQPLMNVKAAMLATSIAEDFRDQGKKVLLMMDSVTRFALARKEIDIASKEIPIMGKTPSMEPFMKRLLERSGTNEKGSITGIYTVLVENDDFNAPIPDMARGILDGHIALDRKLANRYHFPAINVLSSVSRVMQHIAEEEHLQAAREIRKYLALFEENEDNFKIGAIVKGENPELDYAKVIHPNITEFLKQDMNEKVLFEETVDQMKGVFK